jgi:hypothetical protein
VPKIRSLLLLAFDGATTPEVRTGVQRLPIPHTFNDGLTVPGAVLAVAQAFLRILLGCLLFAMWGTLAMWLWGAIPNVVWRVLVLVPVLILFLCSFLALMIGISAATKAFSPKRSL